MHWNNTPRARGAFASVVAFIALIALGSSPAQATFQSDDFHASQLDTTRWTVVNPLADATFQMTGTNLLVHVPGRTSHTMWNSCQCAPLLVQAVPDGDFELEAKFDSEPSQQYQIQGLVVREDDDTFLRFDVHYNGGNIRIFAAYVNGINPPSIKINTSLGAYPPYLRVNRTGTSWQFSYSFDGSAWTSAGSFSRIMAVADAGLFVGNEAIDAYETPGYTASIDYVFNTASPITPEDAGEPSAQYPPMVELWYGDTIEAGTLGVPQSFVNVLGTVWGPNGIASLSYTLNAGASSPLTVGPDGKRLVGYGDFNIEIAYDDLVVGNNDVVVTVTDTLGGARDTTVAINYTDGVVWALPDTASWTTASALTDEAQVVDGHWRLVNDGVRTEAFTAGYERLLVLGDRTWASDYDVVLPFTVHDGDLGGASSVEIVVGWQGHLGATQPRVNGDFQAVASVSDFTTTPTLELRNTGAVSVAATPVTAVTGTGYLIRVRSQSLGADQSHMSVRFWADGSPEPVSWDLEGDVSTSAGSILLVANNADVTFGDVTIEPLPGLGYALETAVAGQGSVLRSPNYAVYPESTVVTLTAVPDSTFAFLGWSGGLSGKTMIQTITMVSDSAVTATFVPGIVSDDFLATELDTALWRVVDPVGDTTLRMSGTNLLFELTEGVSHDLWATCNCAPRILQETSDTDFEIEVKFDSRGRHLYQSQGFVVHQDDDTLLRFDAVYTASTVKLFSAVIDNGVATQRLNHTPSVAPAYLRVTRKGDQWTYRYSSDGVTWLVAGSYVQSINVSEVGVFTANHNDDTFDAPAYVSSLDYFMNTSARIVPEDGGTPTAATPPLVDVWYGASQNVGQSGVPEEWWNVLGRVIDCDSIVSLSYTLNGGASNPLSMGPDGERLDGVGDFIIEVPNSSLVPGTNTVTITALDALGEQTVENVTLEYDADGWWDLPYTADFTTAAAVTDLAHVVTGLWTLNADGVRPATGHTGYDRLLVIGDRDWITDYEVEGTVRIHDGNLGGLSGIGYIVGWQGHEGVDQPRLQPPFQSAGWIRDFPTNPRLELRDDELVRGSVNIPVAADSTYRLKLRSEYIGPALRQVSVKVWEQGTSEPGWQLTDQFTARDGSLLLVAHVADATFGAVTVTPLSHFPDNVLTVKTLGSGTVQRSPSARSYLDGTQIVVTAQADPGWVFAQWAGALSGAALQDTLVINDDTTIEALFLENMYAINVTTVGNGTVTLSPDKPLYNPGDTVIVSAVPDSAWSFSEWAGDLSGTEAVDTLVITRNLNITAQFGVYAVQVSIDGSGTVTLTPKRNFYAPGAKVVLSASGLAGMTFDSWSGDHSGSLNPDTVTVDSTLLITAKFVDNPTPVGDSPTLTELTVRHNSPNPFTAGTFLNYGLPSASDVEVNVYDAAGRRVYTQRIPSVGAGWHRLYFDGRDVGGRSLPSGVYFYRVQTRYSTAASKMVIVR